MNKSQKHLYFIGIGGVGMVWLADWALRQGWQVSGSDLSKSPNTIRLEAAGAKIHYIPDPDQIPKDITEAIITSAITPSAPAYCELLELQRRAIPITKRAVWTGKLTRTHKTIAVAGTHGKTTTTAMIGWILKTAGLDPTVFVGGSLKEWDNQTLIGKGEWLVIEADEFDRSFHNFSANLAVILNIDEDHLDYYKGGIKEINHSFKRFLRNLPVNDGVVVAYGKDKNIRQVTRGFSYKFRYYNEDKFWPRLHLQIPGVHNLLNATAAAKIAHEIGIDSATIQKSLNSFPGVGRRFEHLGKWNKVEIYDDYAHHPNEIKATLQAANERFKGQNFTLVFQAHQKARVQNLLAEFGRCFDQNSPDTVIIAPIYQVAGREEAIEITNQDMAKAVDSKPHQFILKAPQTQKELEQELLKASKDSDVLMVMGAGNISKILEELRKV